MFISITVSNGYEQGRRRALSSLKKGVFLSLKGHVLEWRRACSWIEGGAVWFLRMPLDFLFLYITIPLGVPSHMEGSSFFHGGEFFLSRRIFLSRIEGISFSHRTHRFNRIFPPAFRVHRTPPAYRYHRTFQLKMAVRFCVIGWLNVSVKPCVFCSSVLLCEK